MAIGAEHLAEQCFDLGFLDNQARERASSISFPASTKACRHTLCTAK